jgi:hypothetical protein
MGIIGTLSECFAWHHAFESKLRFFEGGGSCDLSSLKIRTAIAAARDAMHQQAKQQETAAACAAAARRPRIREASAQPVAAVVQARGLDIVHDHKRVSLGVGIAIGFDQDFRVGAVLHEF